MPKKKGKPRSNEGRMPGEKIYMYTFYIYILLSYLLLHMHLTLSQDILYNWLRRLSHQKILCIKVFALTELTQKGYLGAQMKKVLQNIEQYKTF